MRSEFCITAEMDIRTCATRGVRVRNCRDDECAGCEPREAVLGYLCEQCFLRLEQTYAAWGTYAAILDPRGRLASVRRAVQHDNAGIRTTPLGHVNLGTAALMVDECESYLRSAGGHDTLVDWVASSKHASADAVLFTRAAEAAFRAHPVSEPDRKLRRTRCPKCRQLSLVRRSPTEWAGIRYMGEGPKKLSALMTVDCQNPECGITFREGDYDTAGTEIVPALTGEGAA